MKNENTKSIKLLDRRGMTIEQKYVCTFVSLYVSPLVRVTFSSSDVRKLYLSGIYRSHWPFHKHGLCYLWNSINKFIIILNTLFNFVSNFETILFMDF